MIDPQLINAFALSVSLFAVLLSIVTMGLIFYAYKILKRGRGKYIKMGILIFTWSIFVFLNSQVSSDPSYSPVFLVYSISHVASFFVGLLAIVLWFYWFKGKGPDNLFVFFDKNIAIVATIFAVLSLIFRVVFPFFANPYLSLFQRVVIFIPPFFGLLMVIKSLISRRT